MEEKKRWWLNYEGTDEKIKKAVKEGLYEKRERAIRWWKSLRSETKIDMAVKAGGYNMRRIENFTGDEIEDIFNKCVLEASDKEEEILTEDELIARITDSLRETTNPFLMGIAQQVLTKTVTFDNGKFKLKQE